MKPMYSNIFFQFTISSLLVQSAKCTFEFGEETMKLSPLIWSAQAREKKKNIFCFNRIEKKAKGDGRYHQNLPYWTSGLRFYLTSRWLSSIASPPFNQRRRNKKIKLIIVAMRQRYMANRCLSQPKHDISSKLKSFLSALNITMLQFIKHDNISYLFIYL